MSTVAHDDPAGLQFHRLGTFAVVVALLTAGHLLMPFPLFALVAGSA